MDHIVNIKNIYIYPTCSDNVLQILPYLDPWAPREGGCSPRTQTFPFPPPLPSPDVEVHSAGNAEDLHIASWPECSGCGGVSCWCTPQGLGQEFSAGVEGELDAALYSQPLFQIGNRTRQGSINGALQSYLCCGGNHRQGSINGALQSYIR